MIKETPELINSRCLVYVYRNHRLKCWSIRQNNIVRKHAHFLCLTGAKFLVSEAGRQRVIREKRNNVHAGISGYIGTREQWFKRPNSSDRKIIYDPYIMPTFIYEDTGKRINEANTVYFNTISPDTLTIHV